MVWTDIPDFRVHDLETHTIMNGLKDSINYMHVPNQAQYHHPGTGGDYTSTTVGTGVDIDGTNFALTITTTGGPVLACMYGNWSSGSSVRSMRMAIIIENYPAYGSRNLNYNFDMEITAAGNGEPRGWMKIFPDLPAGSYTFKAIWAISAAGTNTLFVANRPYMAVWEK